MKKINKKNIIEYIKTLEIDFSKVLYVGLRGSYSTNTNVYDSDIDVLVLRENTEKEILNNIFIKDIIVDYNDTNLDIMIINENQFNKMLFKVEIEILESINNILYCREDVNIENYKRIILNDKNSMNKLIKQVDGVIKNKNKELKRDNLKYKEKRIKAMLYCYEQLKIMNKSIEDYFLFYQKNNKFSTLTEEVKNIKTGKIEI